MLNVLFSCAGVDVPNIFADLVHIIIVLIEIVVPLILIIFGMIDMAKAVMGHDEKEMKEAQGKLIKRFIYAVIVFLIVAIVRLLVGLVGNVNNDAKDGITDASNISTCLNCFVNGSDNCK